MRTIDKQRIIEGSFAKNNDPQNDYDIELPRTIFYNWLNNHDYAIEYYADMIGKRCDPERGPVYDGWFATTIDVCLANWDKLKRQIFGSLPRADQDEIEDMFWEDYDGYNN